MTTDDTAQRVDIKALSRRVVQLEERSANGVADGASASTEEPELVHKAICACMDDDRIAEREEIRIVSKLLK